MSLDLHLAVKSVADSPQAGRTQHRKPGAFLDFSKQGCAPHVFARRVWYTPAWSGGLSGDDGRGDCHRRSQQQQQNAVVLGGMVNTPGVQSRRRWILKENYGKHARCK